jgi:hypothetical protein
MKPLKKDFFARVVECNHEESSYHDSGACFTPDCRWSEMRCAKCKVYITMCPCGSENYWSGEPRKKAMNRIKSLKRIREEAIANGMTLLTEDEGMEKTGQRRGEE